MVKKIILFSVALLLSVTFIVLALHGSAIVTAGRSNGTSKALSNVEELREALSTIASYGTTDPENRVSATVLLSENAKIKESRHSDKGGVATDADCYRLYKRELEIYYGENAVYYKSAGIFTIEYDFADDEKDDTHSMVEFDIDAYVSAEGCYVKVKELTEATDTATRRIRGTYEGEWIAVAPEIIEYLVELGIIPLSPLVDSITMLDLLIEDEHIDDNDTAVKLGKDSRPEIFKELYPEEEYSVGFDYSIDFSDEDATRVYTYMRIKEGGFWSSLSRTRTELSLTVKDVDNTRVMLDTDRISIEANDMDDFNDMFITKERSSETND